MTYKKEQNSSIKFKIHLQLQNILRLWHDLVNLLVSAINYKYLCLLIKITSSSKSYENSETLQFIYFVFMPSGVYSILS